MSRPSWDQTFLDLATVIARRSKDPSSQVGAVIVDAHRRVVSLGYNGYPRGVEDTADTDPREIKLWKTIHAEENALLFAGRSLEFCTLYVTHHPCPTCAAKIVQAGIRRVVYLRQPGFEKRWSEQLDVSRSIFSQAGVMVEGALL